MRTFGIDPGKDGGIAVFNGKEFTAKAWHGANKEQQASYSRGFIIRHLELHHKGRAWILRGAGFRPNILWAQAQAVERITCKIEDYMEALVINYDTSARSDAGIYEYAKEHGLETPRHKDQAHAIFTDMINLSTNTMPIFWESGDWLPDGVDACIAALAMWKNWEASQ